LGSVDDGSARPKTNDGALRLQDGNQIVVIGRQQAKSGAKSSTMVLPIAKKTAAIAATNRTFGSHNRCVLIELWRRRKRLNLKEQAKRASNPTEKLRGGGDRGENFSLARTRLRPASGKISADPEKRLSSRDGGPEYSRGKLDCDPLKN